MLLHIIPRLYVAEPDAPQCDLIDFHCPDLGLKLRNGIELVARKPYPNKCYRVACRKVGQKAMQGILIETAGRVGEFTTLTRWAVGGDRVVNHQVQYVVLDDELDAITEAMVLWYGMSPSLGGFSQRWPSVAENWTPAAAQPRMELVSRERQGYYADSLDSAGRIVERAEVFKVHTVERERVLFGSKSDSYDRIPTADMAFRGSADIRVKMAHKLGFHPLHQ
ncbi:DUF6012 family protein [Xanthomonas hortorum]|uniref:DUF6012 family protein n=1 Tax=Xanthomonas hortorum pv. hederae TaxID=453603 RepID=A0A9X4H734_9XANT|nr:DUF6012 family protein [Xanthomonas hortorum]MDC8640255.1 DUF6012 family protein [Xanthomonas hortorum pv. hederae]